MVVKIIDKPTQELLYFSGVSVSTQNHYKGMPNDSDIVVGFVDRDLKSTPHQSVTRIQIDDVIVFVETAGCDIYIMNDNGRTIDRVR